MLDLLHSTHLEERSMIETAPKLWYWGGMNNQIKQYAKSCERCQEEAAAKPCQPLVIPDDLSRMAVMEMVGVDLFDLGGKQYVVMVDKPSGYRFCSYLHKTATTDVQGVLEKWFYQYGIPSRLRSDGGPQFRKGFTKWCMELGIKHELLSSYNPSSNSLSEAGVRVVKQTMKKAGVVKGAELDRLMFDLNCMSCGDGSGASIELFLGRNVNTFLHNSGNKFLSVKSGWTDWDAPHTRTSRRETWSEFKIRGLRCVMFKMEGLSHM